MTEQEYNNLVKTHYKLVYRKCLSSVRNLELAEDLTQQTFLKAYKYRKSWKRDAQASTWIYTICVNEIGMYFRYIKSKIEMHVDPRPLDEIWESELKNYTCEIQEPIDRNIFNKNLDAFDWQIIHFLNQGYPSKQIAEILGKTLPAVKSKLHRLRLKLKEDMLIDRPINKRKAKIYKFKPKAKIKQSEEYLYMKATNGN